ncbi:glycosyltransferase family 4 protein [Candidatus Falkowbacteria bacterium]|nr:glycosyltransferase family 4 protein [Candidatus Falkowbacteria bacterium]
MIIGIDASRANRKHKTGTEWYAFYLIKELAKLDASNQYILYSEQPISNDLNDLTDNPSGGPISYDQDGFQVIKSPHGNFKAKVLDWPVRHLWTHLRLSWEMIWHRPDVLFVPSHVLPLIHPRRSVVTIHDVGFERDKSLYPKLDLGPNSKLQKRILNVLVRLFTFGRFGANVQDYLTWSTLFSLRKAEKIITVSEFSKQEIFEVYKDELTPAVLGKIIAIHNGYNQECYRPVTNHDKVTATLEKYDIEPPYIFYLGRLERKKNTPALVEAFGMISKQFPEYKLVLTGRASFGYDEVEFMISQYKLDHKVICTGWVDEADLPYIYGGADIFAFPSHYEGFGIPLVEAMACGVPVAASDVAPITEVVDGAAILFNPESPASIKDALVKLISDKELRNRLSALGLARAKQFGWKITAEKTLAVLDPNFKLS